MKKTICLFLAFALTISLWGCVPESIPGQTEPSVQPTTAPTEPAPTEPPQEPPQDPPVSLDWKEFAFRLDGVTYSLPCDFDQFTNAGWALDEENPDVFPLAGYSATAVYLEKGAQAVMVRLVNPESAAQAADACRVDGIWVFETQADFFQIAMGISMGSCLEEISTALGQGDASTDDSGIQTLRYQTDAGYDQSLTFLFDSNGSMMEISMLNAITLPDREEAPDAPCGHEYSTFEKKPTCTEKGSVTQTCALCGDSRTEILSATGHSYQDGACLRCGEADPSVPVEVSFTVTIRSDKGSLLSGIIVSVYNGGDQPAATATTNSKGVATMTILSAQSYTVTLSNIPDGFIAKNSYTFSSTRVNINLTTLSQITPTDHSKANYKVGSTMGDFTLTDTDGNHYTLSEMLQDNKLIILNFWYVNCGPCKDEFPYFQAICDKYSDDVQLLTLDHIDKESDIIALREQLGYTFPMIAENIGLRQGFGLTMYPTTVLISSSGKILRIITGGFHSEQELADVIAPFI